MELTHKEAQLSEMGVHHLPYSDFRTEQGWQIVLKSNKSNSSEREGTKDLAKGRTELVFPSI